MGIPQFFQWLKKRYSKILQDRPDKPIDNLYLDLNGLVHPCFHPPGRTIENEDQVFLEMFILMDKVIDAVKPQKLVYIAVDGCAPRAKLQQQKKRRFISAYEKQQKFIKMEADVGPEITENLKNSSMDQNCITPGTEFMMQLKKALIYYTSTRKSVNFILDDWSTPGEGEHKIMSFIRSQRSKPNYSVNTTHCIYGLDADLIMLALSSHEPNFYILRDYVNFDRNIQICQYCAAVLDKRSQDQLMQAHVAGVCPSFKKTGQPPIANGIKFISVDIFTFRQYLFQEFNCPSNFERVLDDFVFLCFLAGNDFLPHMACLKIDEGGIIRLIQLYCKAILPLNRFITDSGFVDYAIFTVFIDELALAEMTILRRAQNSSMRFLNMKADKAIVAMKNQLSKMAAEGADGKELEALSAKINYQISNPVKFPEMEEYNEIYENQPLDKDDTEKILLKYINVDSDVNKADFREKYYNRHVDEVEQACYSFLRGMSWVCHYYARGCIDWSWCYECEFPPLAVDLAKYIRSYKHTHFDTSTKPLTPFQQLLAVLPPASHQLLPKAYQKLMIDPKTPLRAFYPNRITCDASNAHALWAAEVCLPVVDVSVIVENSLKCDEFLSEEEKLANKFADPVLICVKNNQYLDENIKEGTKFFNPNCAKAFCGYYSRDKSVQEGFMIYKIGFKNIEEFYCQKNSQEVYWYEYEPEKPVYNDLVRYKFSNCKVSPGFVLARSYITDSLTKGFDLVMWKRAASFRYREDEDAWRIQ